jgi:hypothetical protein
MSESTDYYPSWLGCGAFGATGSRRLQEVTPIVFQPTDLSACSVWFDANNSASLTLDVDNSSILSWQNLGDASGAMVPNVGTGLSGMDTLNGLNVVLFGTSNNMSWYGALTEQPKTCFVVFKCLTDLFTIGVPFLNLWNGDAAAGLQLGLYADSGSGLVYYSLCQAGNWCNNITNTTNPQNIPYYMTARIDTDRSNNVIKLNGVAGTGDSTNNAVGFNTFPIPNSVNRIDGSSMDIAEIIIYNRSLSDEEVAQVEAYLADRWAIT